MEPISDVTIYNGTVLCKRCSALLTPLEALYGKQGVCGDCHAEYVSTLIKNAMAPGRSE